jgi:hypothetical protein
VSRDAGLHGGQGDERAVGAKLLRGEASGRRYLGKALSQHSQSVTVSFEGFAFLLSEIELFQHLLHAALDREQLPGAGLLGQVERAAGAGEPVRAFGEEVVAAVALAEVVVLPRLPSAAR